MVIVKYFEVPKCFHEVFGEQQTRLEVFLTVLFACIATIVTFFLSGLSLNHWQVIAAFLIVFDVYAGCIANFSQGTNQFYAQRYKSRLIFIAIHFHNVIIALLLDMYVQESLLIWGYTIVSACIVNFLKRNRLQTFIAANLFCFGILVLLSLSMPNWLVLISLFFMFKVIVSFAVDHHKQK